ncbi:hypothetical protein [Bradyrhizobium sp. CB3481]|uniref:hypothetical protein n=1 Tax=Bradyrhizobium sp. CB3481 TaxID=3039158 RepID=UPI0024B129A9|nr:hypothetical protein [Bradyrhizobium sp. CB3481]WFU18488.1 hypothetical protein QA643_09130 [Bradyrhizobium sp. CB3481]
MLDVQDPALSGTKVGVLGHVLYDEAKKDRTVIVRKNDWKKSLSFEYRSKADE